MRIFKVFRSLSQVKNWDSIFIKIIFFPIVLLVQFCANNFWKYLNTHLKAILYFKEHLKISSKYKILCKFQHISANKFKKKINFNSDKLSLRFWIFHHPALHLFSSVNKSRAMNIPTRIWKKNIEIWFKEKKYIKKTSYFKLFVILSRRKLEKIFMRIIFLQF